MKFIRSFFPVIALILILVSCSKDDEIRTDLTEFDLLTISYFKEVALGFENGGVTEITRKWKLPMRIYLDGNPSAGLVEKVERTVDEINQIASDGFSIQFVDGAHLANCYIYFGSAADFEAAFPDDEIGSNWAIFNVWWNSNVINKARIFIDTDRPTLSQQKSLILEEITQSLGLGQDSPLYPASIFYETANDGGFVTEYSDLDREIVRLLYHPKMNVGLNAAEVEEVLIDILTSE